MHSPYLCIMLQPYVITPDSGFSASSLMGPWLLFAGYTNILQHWCRQGGWAQWAVSWVFSKDVTELNHFLDRDSLGFCCQVPSWIWSGKYSRLWRKAAPGITFEECLIGTGAGRGKECCTGRRWWGVRQLTSCKQVTTPGSCGEIMLRPTLIWDNLWYCGRGRSRLVSGIALAPGFESVYLLRGGAGVNSIFFRPLLFLYITDILERVGHW